MNTMWVQPRWQGQRCDRYAKTILVNSESTEKAVDKVLDGIDAAKVRDQVIECLDKALNNPDIDLGLYDCDSSPLADELLKQFIITPRS